MYCRTKSVKRGEKSYEYLQIVKSQRVNGEPRQKLIHSLGRIVEGDEKRAVEIAEAIIRFYQKRKPELVEKFEAAGQAGELESDETRHFGDIVAIEDAWQSLELDRILKRLGKHRKFGFSLERAIFAMVANRMVDPRSKLSCTEWLAHDVYLPSVGMLDYDDLYEALSWLESVQDKVEVELFQTLVSKGKLEPTAVFYDTTLTWFEGRGPEELAEFGRKKGGQPLYRRTILIGLVRSQEGWPITHRVFAGNRADVSTVRTILEDLRDRFGVRQCVFVSDRGMVSKEIFRLIRDLGFDYVLATKLRGSKEVREKVLKRPGRFRKVKDNLEVKDVEVGDRRYVVCRNPEGVERDRKRREDILGKLRAELSKSDRADTKRAAELLNKASYRRYLVRQGKKLVLSQKRVKEDERFDGKWVLRTSMEEVSAARLALIYKELGRIEKDFRDLKSFFELRPLYHRTEPRVRAHVFICVLAKAVENELAGRLTRAGKKGLTVEKMLKLLGKIRVTELEVGGEPMWIRSRLKDYQESILEALGIPLRRLPKHVRPYVTFNPPKTKPKK